MVKTLFPGVRRIISPASSEAKPDGHFLKRPMPYNQTFLSRQVHFVERPKAYNQTRSLVGRVPSELSWPPPNHERGLGSG